MPANLLSYDLMSYSDAHHLDLSRTQARALAALNTRKVTGTRYTKGYWKQLGRIIRTYKARQSVKDRLFGTFAAA